MSNYAVIGDVTYHLGPLEVMRIVADRYGFDDVDVEPGVNDYKVTATGRNNTFTVRGADLHEACSRFCERLLG